MADVIRDAPLGQLIRLLTKNTYLQYPEEKADFICPARYTGSPKSKEALGTDTDSHSQSDTETATATCTTSPHGNDPTVAGLETPQRSPTQQDLERALTNVVVETEKRVGGGGAGRTVLVEFYSADDSADPQNWRLGKKVFVTAQICLYTVAVYMGSSIYAPSEPYIIEELGASLTAASLGLALYVLAYGIGPMLWSPLSEIPFIGRNPPYVLTFGIFVLLCVPTALVNNLPGLLVLRFLQGFFGSPCLATGGASLGDMFSLVKLPYLISLWAFAATCGPALGPLISGYSIAAETWHWSMWEMLWLAGPIWLLMFLCLPETYAPTILLRRAQRLRRLTGNEHLRSASELAQAQLSVRVIVLENLYRPLQMMVLDPAVGFTAGYVALLYGIYYSFFEAFPLVYGDMYGFTAGEMGLTFLSLIVGCLVAIAFYWAYIYYVVEPDIRLNGLGAPERRLIPALYASVLLPIGLFIFAWTSDPRLPWIASVIGIGIFTLGVFIVLQCVFLFLPFTYPQYAASLFAGNDLTRSAVAFAAILFSRPMYIGMGVSHAASMLAALTAACVFGIWALWWYGARLRAKSRFATK